MVVVNCLKRSGRWLIGRIRWSCGKCPNCGHVFGTDTHKCDLCRDAQNADLKLWVDFGHSLHK
jgi:uncharacterized OB-fold protein